MMKRKIVTLCGSTKFRDEYAFFNKLHTLAGYIVLSVGYFGNGGDSPPTEEEKKQLDELHKDKIAMSDFIFVINPFGYIGESTKSEIRFARSQGIKVVSIAPIGDFI